MKTLLGTRMGWGLLPLLILAGVLGVVGFAAAQTPNPTGDDPKGGPHAGMIPELQGIPADQVFDHFRGSQFTVTDAQGNAVTYMVTPGTVASVTSNGVTVTPNGQTTPTSFNITPNTMVRAMPANGSVQALAQGDKVVVLSKQGAGDAVAIMKHNARGTGGHMYGGGMMGH